MEGHLATHDGGLVSAAVVFGGWGMEVQCDKVKDKVVYFTPRLYRLATQTCFSLPPGESGQFRPLMFLGPVRYGVSSDR